MQSAAVDQMVIPSTSWRANGFTLGYLPPVRISARFKPDWTCGDSLAWERANAAELVNTAIERMATVVAKERHNLEWTTRPKRRQHLCWAGGKLGWIGGHVFLNGETRSGKA